jgi:hypothetical protein
MNEQTDYEQRYALRASGKSTHHLVTQPGDIKGRRFTPAKRDAKIDGLKTPEEARKDLEDAKTAGEMACCWGCTTKVQSRGCAAHAQARWAK